MTEGEPRAQLVGIVRAHLDEILDRLMQAYDVEIPRIARASEAERTAVREAARRTAVSFLDLYGTTSEPAREHLEEARRVTVERAGELFEREEILAMIHVASNVMFQSARALVETELGADAAKDSGVAEALEAFLGELERTERFIPGGDAALAQLLSMAEEEEPDLG